MQVQLLLDKADGNPQVLIELVHKVRRAPAWFSTDGHLTAAACKEIESMHPSLTQLILERLESESTPQGVREAAALFSLQGMQFLRSLTQRMGERRNLPEVAQGVHQTDAYRLTHPEGPDSAHFVQRAYYEAARQLLGTQVGDPRDIAIELLQACIVMVDDPLAWQELELPERQLALGLLVALGMEYGDGVQRQRVGWALLELGVLAAKSDDAATQVTHARHFVQRLKDGLFGLEGSDFWGLLNALRAIAVWDGPSQAMPFAEQMLAHARAQASDRPEVGREIAVCLLEMGKLTEQQGNLEQAQALLQESLAIRRHLAERLGTPDVRKGLAIVQENLRNLKKAQKQILKNKRQDAYLAKLQNLFKL